MKLHPRYRIIFLALLTPLLSVSCRKTQDPTRSAGSKGHSYVQVLEHIERAGNHYRRAMDLVKFSDSSLERSLAESHLQLSRQFLESEFQLAEIESKVLALTEPGSKEAPAATPTAAEQSQYEKIVAEVSSRDLIEIGAAD